MNSVEEIERAAEQLVPADFARLTAWLDARGRVRGSQPPNAAAGVGEQDRPFKTAESPTAIRPMMAARDHSAFLNSYAPEDEGLYDDAPAR